MAVGEIRSVFAAYLTRNNTLLNFTMPKRKAYSVKEKLEVVAKIRNGQTQAQVSRETGIAEGTIRGWLKDETKLRDFVHEVDESEGLQRKRARTAKDAPLDKAMFTWFVQEQNAGVPLGGPILRAQALKFNNTLNPT